MEGSIFKSGMFWGILIGVILLSVLIYFLIIKPSATLKNAQNAFNNANQGSTGTGTNTNTNSSLPLVITKATYICPGSAAINSATLDVTSVLQSKIVNNAINIPTYFNMMGILFGTSPDFCGCPNNCTHTRLDVSYTFAGVPLTASFPDTASIILP